MNKFLINLKKSINKKGVNVVIILAAGNGTRFGEYKQLYKINNKPIIEYSIDNIKNIVNKIIIVTNSNCYNEIKKYSDHVIINDINCRMESIKIAINYLNTLKINIKNVIIHDSARPFVTKLMFKKILNTKYYSQYYMKLVNGLISLENDCFVDRDKYIEACTPLCINYKLLKYIHNNYSKIYEYYDIIKTIKLKIVLIEGHYKYLKKITTKDDI